MSQNMIDVAFGLVIVCGAVSVVAKQKPPSPPAPPRNGEVRSFREEDVWFPRHRRMEAVVPYDGASPESISYVPIDRAP